MYNYRDVNFTLKQLQDIFLTWRKEQRKQLDLVDETFICLLFRLSQHQKFIEKVENVGGPLTSLMLMSQKCFEIIIKTRPLSISR